MLDFVFACDLLGNELGVPDKGNELGFKFNGPLKPADNCPVFGHIVGRVANALTYLIDQLALVISDHHSDARRAGITSGTSIAMDD
jgi:hypothetical protein